MEQITTKLEITIDIAGSMLQAEDAILEALNETGAVATEEAPSQSVIGSKFFIFPLLLAQA